MKVGALSSYYSSLWGYRDSGVLHLQEPNSYHIKNKTKPFTFKVTPLADEYSLELGFYFSFQSGTFFFMSEKDLDQQAPI